MQEISKDVSQEIVLPPALIDWHDNHGRKDEHLPIGEGLIEHEKVVRALKDIGYYRTITLEVFTNSNDAKSSMDKLNIIWSRESY